MTPTPEFCRPLAVDRIGPGGLMQSIAATETECAALARRFGIPAVRSLGATFHLVRGEAGRIAASATLAGRLTRECVVSLDAFDTDIAESFSVAFVPETMLGEAIDLAGEDEIPYAGGTIDLGEATAEQVALTLDPYPRRPGVALPEAAADAPESPFGRLAERLRRH
jgi:hypothetical protein